MTFLNHRNTAFACLAVISLLVFWPSLFNQFTNWDDDKFLTGNSIVQNLSWENLRNIWTMHFEDGYQPLTMFSFAVEYRFFQLNPFVYHLDNLLLHIANGWLVFLVIGRLTRQTRLAFATALLFAVHPMRVESVAWVSERKDLLFSFFYLLSLWAYCKNRAGACFLLLILACLAKHQAASLPLVLLLIDGDFSRPAFLKKAHFFLASAVFLFATVSSAAPHWSNIHMYSWGDKVFLVNTAVLIYLFKTVVPYQLCCVYASPGSVNGHLPWVVYISPLAVGCLVFLAFKTLRYTRWVWFGGMFFLSTIALPLANVLYGGIFIYDRYTYLPSIGVFLLIVYFLEKQKNVFAAALVSYALVMSWMTFERCKVWHDGVTLWSDAIKNYPQYAVVYEHRGTAYGLQGKDDLALRDFSTAIELDPRYAVSYNNRAYIYQKQGRFDLALQDYNSALREDPGYGTAFYNRSVLYFQMKQGQPLKKD